MIDYSYKELEECLRGKVLVPTRRKRFKGTVSTDTRTLKPGEMFIALKGPNFDGHNHIDEAFEKGARICIAEQSCQRSIKRRDPDIIFVEDTTRALGRLGAFHRRMRKTPVIAITGSCGKTTTKDLISHLLSSKHKVLKNIGTENNKIGVPKTLLQLDDHDVAVIEIGTGGIGEIRHLARMVDPDYAVLTMIGNAHLTGFRSIMGVKREKLSLLEALKESACFVYNSDDPNIIHPRLKTIKTIKVGMSKKCDVYAERVHLMNEGVAFILNGKYKIISPLMGRHNVMNMMLAVAVAGKFGIQKNKIPELLKTFDPPKGRLRYQEHNGIHWIDDSYNSNPSSLDAAIELFKQYPPKSRKVLAIGDMLELGERANAFHREAGRSIANYSFDMVVTVGELGKKFKEEAEFCGFQKDKMLNFKDSESAGKYLKKQLRAGDTVLLKGSRRMKMERIMHQCGVPD